MGRVSGAVEAKFSSANSRVHDKLKGYVGFCAGAIRPGIVFRRFTGKNVTFAHLSASSNNRCSYFGKGILCSAPLSGAHARVCYNSCGTAFL